MKKYINQHIEKAKRLIRNENNPEFDPLTDDKENGTNDIENIDDWMKEITNKND